MSAHKYNWAGYCIYCQCANHSIRADQSCPAAPSMQPAPATEQATQILAELLQACGWDESTDDSLRYEESQGNEAATVILRAREFITGQASRATQAERVQSSESIAKDKEFIRLLGSYVDGVAGQWELVTHINEWGAKQSKAGRAYQKKVDGKIDARRATASTIRIESIDCPEFRALADAYHCATQATLEDAYDAMVAHVDGYIKSLDFRATASKAEAPAGACNADWRAAPAGQHDAPSPLFADLHRRLLEMSEIIREGARWTGNEIAYGDKTESDIAMLDDILTDALRLSRATHYERNESEVAPAVTLLSIEEWNEEHGDCLFFHFENFDEAPEVCCSSPLVHGFDEDHWTHFARLDLNSIIGQAITATTKQGTP